MPTYHFSCGSCQQEFTMHLPMGTEKKPTCPTCKSAKSVEKIIKPPMIHFKGSGFYTTDSSGKGSQGKQEPKGIKETKDVKAPEAKKEATTPAPKTSDVSK